MSNRPTRSPYSLCHRPCFAISSRISSSVFLLFIPLPFFAAAAAAAVIVDAFARSSLDALPLFLSPPPPHPPPPLSLSFLKSSLLSFVESPEIGETRLFEIYSFPVALARLQYSIYYGRLSRLFLLTQTK